MSSSHDDTILIWDFLSYSLDSSSSPQGGGANGNQGPPNQQPSLPPSGAANAAGPGTPNSNSNSQSNENQDDDLVSGTNQGNGTCS